jgi:hypothetical protein
MNSLYVYIYSTNKTNTLLKNNNKKKECIESFYTIPLINIYKI